MNVKVLNLIEEGLVGLDGSQRGFAGKGAVGADVGVLVIAEVDLQQKERKENISKYNFFYFIFCSNLDKVIDAIDQLRLVADRLGRRQTAASQLALQLRADLQKKYEM